MNGHNIIITKSDLSYKPNDRVKVLLTVLQRSCSARVLVVATLQPSCNSLLIPGKLTASKTLPHLGQYPELKPMATVATTRTAYSKC